MYNRYEYFRKRNSNFKILKEVPQTNISKVVEEEVTSKSDIVTEETDSLDTSKSDIVTEEVTKKRRGRRKTNTSPDIVDTKEVDT